MNTTFNPFVSLLLTFVYNTYKLGLLSVKELHNLLVRLRGGGGDTEGRAEHPGGGGGRGRQLPGAAERQRWAGGLYIKFSSFYLL